ncbi:hypothetical protein MRBLWH13_003425 [Microbacterium sp. LWH13-1.2]
MRQIGEERIVQCSTDTATTSVRYHRELDELEMAADPLIDARAELA